MKLKDTFITYESGSDHVMVDASSSFSGLVRSNPTAAYILECLKTDTSEQEIIAKMLEKYDVDEQVVSADVHKILEQLRGIGAIDG